MKILNTDYLLVTLDYESFYGTGCSLSSLNTFGYLTHPEFTVHGVGVKIEDRATVWFRDTAEAIAYIEDEACDDPIALLCHNTCFDGYILHHFYDFHPDLYLDTMAMSRGLFPTESASLEKLAERLWPNEPLMRKGKELINFRGVTTEQLYDNPPMLTAMTKYCAQDCNLTYQAFLRMEPFFPDSELELIELTTRMMCEPILTIDVPRVVACRDGAILHRDAMIKASGYSETLLSSNAQFERLLVKLDIPVPLKESPTVTIKDEVTGEEKPKMIAALGKADLGFQDLRRQYPEHEPLWQGRIAAKSVGEITRAERFIETADQCHGYMPVALVYYSAHTGRYGGGEKLNLQNMGRGSELRRSLCVPTREVAV